MKLKSGVIVTEANGEYVAIAAGEAGKSFNGMIKMNETAAFIAKTLENEMDVDSVVDAVCGEYDVDSNTARENVMMIIEKLSSIGLIEK